MRFPAFIGPSYTLRSVNVDCQRCINMFPELNELGTGKEREIACLVSTPGLSLLATVGDGPIRGLYKANNGRVFVVSKNKLFELSSLFAATERGTLNTSLGQVSIADNGFDLVLVDGPNGYSLNFDTNAFAQIVDEAFYGANQVQYIDGFLVFDKPDSQTYYYTELRSLTFNALNEYDVEGAPDGLTGFVFSNRDMYFLGAKSIEVWYPTGVANDEFSRSQGAFVEVGCAARFSIAKAANTVFWLGSNDAGQGIVYRAQGYQPQRVSTHAVEQAIQSYSNISDAVAYSYQADGHEFYVLNFPSANTTWVYDVMTNLWHERVYMNQGQFERHRANCHVFAFGKHIVGDYATGKIYEMSSTFASDDGVAIPRERTAPHFSDGLVRITHNAFQLDIETGVGLDGVGQGTDPKAMLQFSDDGGHSWSNEKWADLGKIGETRKRVKWRRLGMSRDRVYRIRITDPVRVTMIGAELDVTKGLS